MANFLMYEKNEKRADELQEKYGLTMTLRDLFAEEILTEAEVIALQKYKDIVQPSYTGDTETDSLLTEAFEKKLAELNFTESILTNSGVKDLYTNGCLTLDEAVELQKLREILN